MSLHGEWVFFAHHSSLSIAALAFLASALAFPNACSAGSNGSLFYPLQFVCPQLRTEWNRTAVVNRVVKKSAAAARLSPALFGAHSLRSGWITTAAGDGSAEADIMRHSRHLSIAVMRGYIRRANKWESHAGDGLL